MFGDCQACKTYLRIVAAMEQNDCWYKPIQDAVEKMHEIWCTCPPIPELPVFNDSSNNK